MPNQYVNKVVFGNQTLLDLTSDTVTPSVLMEGYTAHDKSGALIIGTATGGGTGAISVVDTADSHGGTVRTITALDISDTTAQASDVASGKYFYTADGTKTQGTASGGGGGLEYEEGTVTIQNQTTPYDITFSNTHSSLPIFYVISQASDLAYNSQMLTVIFSLTESMGTPSDENYHTDYGMASVIRVNASGTMGVGSFRFTVSSASTDETNTTSPRYWATNSRIRLYASTTYQIGGTYKWIAVWA